MNLIEAGQYVAQASSTQYGFGATPDGNPFVTLMCRITEGRYTGQRLKWTGFLTPRALARTVKQLRTAGYRGGIEQGRLDGIGSATFMLVVEHEGWNGKTYPVGRWINAMPTIQVGREVNPALLAAIGRQIEQLEAAVDDQDDAEEPTRGPAEPEDVVFP